jgi:hypothetical protein
LRIGAVPDDAADLGVRQHRPVEGDRLLGLASHVTGFRIEILPQPAT